MKTLLQFSSAQGSEPPPSRPKLASRQARGPIGYVHATQHHGSSYSLVGSDSDDGRPGVGARHLLAGHAD
jgi:hypothetical protein